jgi:hypothetical protein
MLVEVEARGYFGEVAFPLRLGDRVARRAKMDLQPLLRRDGRGDRFFS